MDKFINEVSSAGISTATDDEPDFGNWLGAGKVRKLGAELNGRSDVWFHNGGYTQTEFPQADDIWGGKFDELTEFNLDPGIYRLTSQQRLKVPKSWEQIKKPKKKELLDKPNSVKDGEELKPRKIKRPKIKIPKYRDFF